jgi:hypothetical protein
MSMHAVMVTSSGQDSWMPRQWTWAMRPQPSMASRSLPGGAGMALGSAARAGVASARGRGAAGAGATGPVPVPSPVRRCRCRWPGAGAAVARGEQGEHLRKIYLPVCSRQKHSVHQPTDIPRWRWCCADREVSYTSLRPFPALQPLHTVRPRTDRGAGRLRSPPSSRGTIQAPTSVTAGRMAPVTTVAIRWTWAATAPPRVPDSDSWAWWPAAVGRPLRGVRL